MFKLSLKLVNTCLILCVLSFFSSLTYKVYAEPLSYDVVILGSGPSGLSASIYTGRNMMKTLVVEGPNPGGSIVRAKKVENYPGFPGGISGDELMEKMYTQAASFNVEFSSTLASRVTPQKKGHLIDLSDKTQIFTKTLIVATGTSEHFLGLSGEQELIDNGIFICAECDAPFFKGKTVFIAGSGKHALEEALHIIDFVERLTIVSETDELNAPDDLIASLEKNPKLSIFFNSKIVKLGTNDPRGSELTVQRVVKKAMRPASPTPILTSIDILDLSTQTIQNYKLDGLLLATGELKANTAFLPKELKKDRNGYILIRNSVETSIPGIFAAGNVFDKEFKQVVVATGLGAQAAMRATKYVKEHTW